MLDVQALGTLLRSAEHDLFRLEARDRYEVPSDGGDFGRYMAGEAAPDPDRKAAWQRRLAAEKARGLHRWRVHVVTEPLSDYLRYEFDWGHRLNAHLEDIRVLALPEMPEGLLGTDWYLVDDRDVVDMRYDGHDRFTGAVVLPAGEAGPYLLARAEAWERAVPLTEWWDRHPQYHRVTAA
jgi:hypothetical protein